MTTDIDALLRQRDEIKRRDPEAILLFRVDDHRGDLYRAYGNDAHVLRTVIEFRIPGIQYHHHGTVGDWTGIRPEELKRVLSSLESAGKRATVIDPDPPGAASTDREREDEIKRAMG